ncbi:MAG: transcription-repair coupling factor, transcription-repair coupling factor (superfamily II helicase) [Candidatus Peregrinibacteria bacterium GW2011_GWF2_33_10]|nr:MAG: transcription-repair coupling factor, transcription-repair coupling factor (superfamily II helicase) [Candidatus Peregrinibacteria bacterium GW2011_GWF2_33_10]OGJ45754.1 MAG: transcription-repair coupling factor [Candidatus Peregrinibacteria bacterium RIFOXYA2_FULL_33_21]OGJ46814.1 MAG: transcription-repair coupling factor [Candidatus Peregrinibacteria bacterium RIFOXYA12_FULL_33_12]OGJ51284.1 MAG: transcription-repair coupling factor [Candidatus Peregrinibacteria bacterium RIFOXYB2_FULL
MSKDLTELIKFFPKAESEVAKIFSENQKISISGAANASVKAFLLSGLLRKYQGNIFWVASAETEREILFPNLQKWTDKPILNSFCESGNEVQKKTQLVNFAAQILNQEKSRFFVLTYEDLLRPFPNKSALTGKKLVLTEKEEFDALKLCQFLISLGYRVSQHPEISQGEYYKKGEIMHLAPIGYDQIFMLDLVYDKIENIFVLDEKQQATSAKIKSIDVLPINVELKKQGFMDYIENRDLFVEDEWEVLDEHEEEVELFLKNLNPESRKITITPFMEDDANHYHLHTFSLLKYQNLLDLAADLKEKISSGWKVFIATKHSDYLEKLFKDQNIPYLVDEAFDFDVPNGQLRLQTIDKDDFFVESFQNPRLKLTVITDKNLLGIKEENKEKKKNDKNVYLDFLTSLKRNDYVVHVDHGIGIFQGIEKRTIDNVTREYLKVAYAEGDKLYVPIDQAEKVNKYIGAADQEPRLTRLGSIEWKNLVSKVKKETQEVARELLDLYAKREQAKGHAFTKDNELQQKFEETFPYTETPGQIKAILDVKKDMEQDKPMDRLICGDVGFGKTEVAIRAAFKAVQGGRQVAFISPITILADQHYKFFCSRMNQFGVRVEMLSRFRSQKEQEEVLKKLKKGLVDVVIGTHRLLQKDIEFSNLGLVMIDEEQRFGVKQKEVLKKMRAEVDILTLTATPIPRTLNISLNGLRDITTITTPPPGRLPIITEVRRFSNGLISEAINRELARGGQVYFLHNRVQTIESAAHKLRSLLPNARIVVTHGKLKPELLEKNILDFKEGRYDILVSSMIIENGIDLPNANTLIVSDAERFGLAQLYQLRGRVGRSRKQAYAYFLYHAQRLKVDAKKRLRALVEATELGSGFQIAMKDLEIRGAGEILGVHQHGTLNVVGVSHFVRLLNQAVEDLKQGVCAESSEVEDVTIELPVPAFIPDLYIPNTKEKIAVYQRLSSADSKEYLEELRADLIEDYGRYPMEVANLFKVLELKMLAKKAHISLIKAENLHDKKNSQIVLFMTDKVKPENIMNMIDINSKWQITSNKLRIKSPDLGLNWIEGLEMSLERLGCTFEAGK